MAAEGGEILCEWLRRGNDEDLSKVKNNLEKVEKYLWFRVGLKGWESFEKTRNICNDNYNKMCADEYD